VAKVVGGTSPSPSKGGELPNGIKLVVFLSNNQLSNNGKIKTLLASSIDVLMVNTYGADGKHQWC